MKYVPPLDGDLGNPDRPYVDGNPTTGTEGSVVPAAAIEHPQREILAVLAAAGIVPDPANLAQLLQAIILLIEEAAPGTMDIVTGTTGTLTVARGGTGATTAADARNQLGVPARDGGDAVGMWGISITGKAADSDKLGGAAAADYAKLTGGADFAGNLFAGGVVRSKLHGTGYGIISSGYYDADNMGMQFTHYGYTHPTLAGRSDMFFGGRLADATHGGAIYSRPDLGYLNFYGVAGARSDVRVNNNRILTVADGAAVQRWESAQQALTLGGSLTLAHALGAKPRKVWYALVCLTAEHGYSVGDEIFDTHDSSSATVPAIAVAATATSIKVRFSWIAIQTQKLDASGYATLTPGNWGLIVRAEI